MNRITFLFVTIILASEFQIVLSTTPTLSQGRTYLTSTSVGNLALFAAGWNGTLIVDRVDIFNYTSKIWSTAALSQARRNVVATSVLDLAMFAGGINALSVYSDRLDIYNSTSNSWSYMSLPPGRSGFVVTSVRDIVLFAGGTYSGQKSNRVDIFNVTSQIWTTANLSIARSALAATTVKDLALFAAGTNGTAYSDRVDIYNVTSNNWTTASLSQPRTSLVGLTLGDLAIFAGGDYLDAASVWTFSDAVDIFNSTSKTWTTASLSQPRTYLTGTSVHDVALFAGGNDYDYSDRVDIYNLTSNTWTTATLSQPRSYLVSTSVLDLALFAGGSYFDGFQTKYSDRVDIYNATYNVWTPQTCQPGTYVNLSASIGSCSNCPEGTYSSDLNSPNCSVCEAGSYSSEGASQCLTCPFGTISKPGSSSCSCQAGSVPNATSCFQCLPGTYATEGSPSCTPCPEGTASGATGAISVDTCQTCGAGLYSLEGASQCLACPNGTTSKPGSSSCSKSEKGDPTTKLKIAIAVVAATFGLTLIGIVLALIRFAKKRQLGNATLELVDVGHWTVIDNIEIGERLGGGNFGDVFKGTWNETTAVALKKLKSKDQLEEFAKEADVLQSLNHPNIVRFLGIHTSITGEQFIVMEYLPKGSVDVLLALEKQSLTLVDLLAMAKDAAAGMLYLEQQKIVHRDLALRNLLAAPDQREKYTIKVSDFGLSRQIKEEGFYMKLENTGIPIRWSAPEVLEKGVYSSKSDVWSFGIMLWELFSYGQIPYTGMTNTEVMQRVVAGHQLDCPQGCPQELYELMGRCWHHRPEARPTFKHIHDQIKSIWNEHRTGNVDVVVDNLNIQPSNSNNGNQVIQQPINSNYNNQVAIVQPSDYNNQVVQPQSNSNYN